ncbi:hypothetical protein BGZ82_002455, partial [Podila clonocystis]
MTSNIKVFCLVDGEATSNAFSIKIPSNDTVDDLKDLIKAKQSPDFDDIVANKLTLWRVSISDDKQGSAITIDALDDKTELNNPRTRLSKLFPESPDDNTYIVVQRPPQGEWWRNLIGKIESDFFASESMEYARLVEFVKGGAKVPTTEGCLGGLPRIRSRASGEANRPSLLFLNLPESSETQDPPSTADKALKKIRERAIPLLPFFGVTGCGKTRTAIEMLSKNWGFYFNGSGTDLGSGDLLYLLELVQSRKQDKTWETESNTHVKIMALAL